MFANLFDELGSRGASVLFGLLLGSIATWLIARWRRHQERRRILRGDAREMAPAENNGAREEQ